MRMTTEQLYQHAVTARNQGNWDKVIQLLQPLVQAIPDHAKALHLMGLAKSVQKDHETAKRYVLKAIELSENQQFLNTLGLIYLRMDRISNAIEFFKKALIYDQKSPEIYNNLAQANLFIGNSHEAIKNFEIALSLRTDISLMSNYLLGLNYVPFVSPEQIFQAHRQYAQFFSEQPEYKDYQNHVQGKIRIGYVAGHFCQNPIRFFLMPVLKNHDHSKFTIICYSDTQKEDEVTDQYKQYVLEWNRTCHLSHDELASKIYADHIDILVDLAGHVSSNRLPVFARQPAKYQFTWLGYPNTTGLSQVHYRFTDAIADPPENDACYSEKLIRLPTCFLSYQPEKNSPEVSSLPADHKKEITLGSFNNLSKVNDSVIKLWSEILKSLPNTRLLIKATSLSDPKVQEYVINKFKCHGVENEIKCTGFIKNMQSHLAMYHQVDLALDPFPYNGTTTTCDALWMGVPVLTRCGKTHASRVGASILSCIGMGDLVAYSDKEYVSKAIYLCQHIDILRAIRKQLRQLCLQSPLMDCLSFTQSMEKIYDGLVREH